MKILEIIELLKKQGKSITYRKRSDGGYLITSIDGVKYTGGTGNTTARNIVGAPISEKQANAFKASTTKRITTATERKRQEINKTFNRYVNAKTKKFNTKKKVKEYLKTHTYREYKQEINYLYELTKLPKSIRDLFNKVYRAWESNVYLKGKMKIETALRVYHEEGYQSVMRKLKNNYRYALGYINEKNARWLILRLETYNAKYQTNLFDRAIKFIRQNKLLIKDSAVDEVNDILYKLDQGLLPLNEALVDMIITALSHDLG